MKQLFTALDTDKDGTISQDEAAALKSALSGTQSGTTGGKPPPLSEALLKHDDANSDGSISQDELSASRAGDTLSASFTDIDTDLDSQLSADELNVFEAKSKPGGPAAPWDAAEKGAANTPANSPKSLFESLIAALSQANSADETQYNQRHKSAQAYAA